MSLTRTIAPAIADLPTDLSIVPEVKYASSGARMHVYKNHIQPVVRIEFVFKAGKWYQPKAGVASLTAKMLKEGTAFHTAKEIADTVDYYGASLEITHGFDRATVTLYCLSKFLPFLLPLTFEIIQQPSFPEKEFALMKQRVIQTLTVDKQKNGYLATETFTGALYGKYHPYTTFISEEEISALRLTDLQDFHSQAYTFPSSEIFITGDITDAAVEGILTLITSQKASSLQEPVISPLKGHAEDRLIIEKTSNDLQASIRAGKPIIHPSHPDYPALYLLNHVLGGYFGSRLMKNIREDKGFTYGIYSSLSHKEHSSLFSIGTDTKGDKIEETLAEILKEIALLRNELVPENELATTKKHLAGKFLSDHATLFDKMDKYKSNTILNLGTDFSSQLLEKIADLEASQLLEAANKYFQEEDLLQVVTGGATK
ncbi:M16 family metallopeptidase [Rufibacter glacialis]|uniref:Insulinase family protein n=1 Tax=Rufibacter glacialis TaxID=1259555 RepID=A0A5M8QPY1_9BACT|nr:pitrilysin family protein [Rufibacter glacialis]KAA6437100.1 insulinase family protein [Rufibacter glacialis]GGK62085.1 peptidase M16 [Rufibacter glacialis]